MFLFFLFQQASSGMYNGDGSGLTTAAVVNGAVTTVSAPARKDAVFYSTAIQGNYSITPAAPGANVPAAAVAVATAATAGNPKFNALVVQKQEGPKVFSVQ